MSKELDEMMIELDKEKADLESVSHELDVNKEWNDIFFRALHMACERIAATADPNFFDKDKEDQKNIILEMMLDYTMKAKDGEYHGKHC